MAFTEKPNGGCYWTCDNCNEEIDAEELSFDADRNHKTLWEAAKDRGWRAFKNDDDEWRHSCPDCVREWAQNQ
jgi:hypothetical protein